MDSRVILESAPLELESQTEAGHHSGAGAGAVQVATTPADAAVTLIIQMTLSVSTKTLGPVGLNTAQGPLFKVYTVTNLTAFIIDVILLSYIAFTWLSSAVRPTAQRMAVVKTLIWVAMVLSFISFLLGFFVLLTV